MTNIRRRDVLRNGTAAILGWLTAKGHSFAGNSVWQSQTQSFVFVSLLQKKQVVTWRRDRETGALTQVAETKCPAEPANTLASANGRLLFVALRGSGELASYRINAKTGSLELLSVVAAGDDPAFLLLDRSGRFLVTAYYISNKVTVHSISRDGKLSDDPVDAHSTAQNAHGICMDKSNTFVRVSHTRANRIDQFRFDQMTGKLTPLDPPFVAAKAGQNPRHIVMHPSDRWAYCSNEAGASSEDGVSCYECDPTSGQLRLIQSVKSVPDDFDAMQNSTAECLLSPNGRFLFVANRGHNSIAGFAIDQTTGLMSRISVTPTEAVPRSFAISSDGRFLYSAGEITGNIACFRIESTGQLARFDTINSGPVSWCIACVETVGD